MSFAQLYIILLRVLIKMKANFEGQKNKRETTENHLFQNFLVTIMFHASVIK